MDDADGLVWFANDDDARYVWRTGRVAIGVAALPVLLALCAVGRGSGSGTGAAVTLSVLLLLPLGVGAGTAVAYVLDRRRIVRMHLRTVPGRPPTLELTRANGRRAAYPLASVPRIDLDQEMYLGVARSATMRLVAMNRIERTRPGPGDLPERWVDVLRGAGVVITSRRHYPSDRLAWRLRERGMPVWQMRRRRFRRLSVPELIRRAIRRWW